MGKALARQYGLNAYSQNANCLENSCNAHRERAMKGLKEQCIPLYKVVRVRQKQSGKNFFLTNNNKF